MRPRSRIIILLAAGALGLGSAQPAAAQSPAPSSTPGWQASPWADSVLLQTQLRFDLESPDGKGVSDQQWKSFAAEVIGPRFPKDVSELSAAALSPSGRAGARLVLILHPNSPDALAKIAQITAEYGHRFGGAQVLRLDHPVRVTP
ncbi:MAG: DUF3574 domain-containing protein [Pseudomonadota bacterium]